MEQTPPLRLPPHLDNAAQRVRLAARLAAEQTVDSLGLAAMATSQVLQRDALLGAQYELNRKLALFTLSFNEALDTEVAREAGLLTATPRPDITPEGLVANWESLTLVDNHEVELHISADRFALEIAHTCEWELREFDAYMATLMGLPAADHSRNPLRAEVVAQAMMRAIDALSGRTEVRKVLATEIGRALAQAMRKTYADTVTELRDSGLRPVGLVVRQSQSRSQSQHGGLGGSAHPADTHHGLDDERTGAVASTSTGTHSTREAGSGFGRSTGADARHSAQGDSTGNGASSWPGSSRHGGDAGHPASGKGRGTARGTPMGQVEASMMGLIRRLALSHGPWPDTAPPGDPDLDRHGAASRAGQPPGPAGTARHSSLDGQPLVAPNLIAAHRDALRHQAGSPLDHLVIDLVAGLFDQILSDPKVPPQFARQIARLQLPVLRAALGDPAFFSSRRHPVRRLVNRIASLGAAADDPASAQGAALLRRVSELVQAVLAGEFDQAEVYEQQLQALEAFVAEAARAELAGLGDAQAVLARKEDELQQQLAFGAALDDALRPLPVPDYLRAFITQVWARAIVRTERKEGASSPLSRHLRDTAVALVMSVQPKGAPAQRQLFLRKLPQLMKDVQLGLDHVRCEAEVRKAFFGQLLPGQAQAMKQPPLSTLEHNLLARQVAEVMALALAAAGAPAGTGAARHQGLQAAQALQALAVDASFSPAEAQAVGLLAEQTVDWDGAVDIDLGQEPELQAVDIAIDGLPAPEAPEPTRGASLVDHLQLGMAYQMHLEGGWHKVRLAHVSPGRGFFVFTHGNRHRRTASLTHRMLQRLADTGRLRCLENAYLIERATARARRQLAALKPAAPH